MGRITYRCGDSTVVLPLAARTLIGRAPQCLVRLRWGFISREHAIIEHRQGSYWVKLLSPNGLQLRGKTVELGAYVKLDKGDTFILGRGQGAPELTMVCDAPPQLIAHELGSGAVVTAEPGTALQLAPKEPMGGELVSVVAAGEYAGAYVARGGGQDGFRTLYNGEVLSVGGAMWMVHFPNDDTRTAPLGNRPLDLRRCRLRLQTDEGGDSIVVSLLPQSSDARPNQDGERVVLSRTRYASTLLALAEKKQEDLRQGVPERHAGWVTNDELRMRLGCRPGRDENLPYLHPFRLKRLFEAANVHGLGQLFERDQGALRLGVSDFEIAAL